MNIQNQPSTQIMPSNSNEALALACKLIRLGDVVAIPTETVYGLGADALNPEAVKKIFEIKGRPQDNPLIVHVSSIAMWEGLVQEITPDALTLARTFWPGPLTIILPKSDSVPLQTSAGLDTVGVRMPSHPDTLKLIELCDTPIAAPSANISGLPSPTTAFHCADDLWGKVSLILDGGACSVGIESTVISMVGTPVILRPGKISAKEIQSVLGKPVEISPAVTQPLPEGQKVQSPGMKYRHYAPKAKVTILLGDLESFLLALEDAPENTFGLVFEGEDALTMRPCETYGKEHDPVSQAQKLFCALRDLDDRGAGQIYARCPDFDEETLGVYNRLLRAAAFEIKKV